MPIGFPAIFQFLTHHIHICSSQSQSDFHSQEKGLCNSVNYNIAQTAMGLLSCYGSLIAVSSLWLIGGFSPSGRFRPNAIREQQQALFATPSVLRSRPSSAVGTFWRIISINDIYCLDNYPHVAGCIQAAAAAVTQKDVDCVVTSHVSGDFLSPSIFTALDGGSTLMTALNEAGIDFCSLGNHEFDIGKENTERRLKEFQGTVINSNVDDLQGDHPEYVILDIGDRKAVIGGFLTSDETIFRPCNQPNTRDVKDACSKLWDKVKSDMGVVAKGVDAPDVFLPMTHQAIQDDQELANHLALHPELKAKTPVILGGHEHHMYIEQIGQSVIAKMGLDANQIGIIDIWWTEDGAMKQQINILPAIEFPRCTKTEEWMTKQKNHLRTLMGVPLAYLPHACTSKNVRFEESAIASFLLKLIKRGMARDGVELAWAQGGAIRAKADYEPGPITMEDVYHEFPFKSYQIVADIPGHIIADTIHNSRAAPKPAPGFIHLDDDCEVVFDKITGIHTVAQIDGQAFDPDKMYRMCCSHCLFTGLNNLQPFHDYVKENIDIPDVEACPLAKDLIIETCMKAAWRRVVGIDYWDTSCDEELSREELVTGIEKAFAAIDTDGNGMISQAELLSFMENASDEDQQEIAGRELATRMIQTLDTNNDGFVDRNELTALAY